MSRLVFVLALICFCPCAWGQGQTGQQALPSRYFIRYLCFTITPRPGAVFTEKPPDLPPLLQELQRGWAVPLTQDPKQFMTALRKAEPRYEYHLELSGQSVLGPDTPCRLKNGPRPGDPRACRVDFTVSFIKADSATVIHTHMKGMYYFILDPEQQVLQAQHPDLRFGAGAGMDDTSVPEGNTQVLGHTKDMGLGSASMAQTVFVYCVLPG